MIQDLKGVQQQPLAPGSSMLCAPDEADSKSQVLLKLQNNFNAALEGVLSSYDADNAAAVVTN